MSIREMERTVGYTRRRELTEINAMPVKVDPEEAANPKRSGDAMMR
jgi:hypothetical protein